MEAVVAPVNIYRCYRNAGTDQGTGKNRSIYTEALTENIETNVLSIPITNVCCILILSILYIIPFL